VLWTLEWAWQTFTDLSVKGARVGVAIFFVGVAFFFGAWQTFFIQSIGIDETYIF